MTYDEIEFVECAELDDDGFDRFYRDVLQPAFPPTELGDLEKMRAGFGGPLPGHLGVVALRDGEPIGGALGEYSEAGGVLLLAYLAVRQGTRGGGLGRRLLDRALPRWREAVHPVVTLAEIEDPRFHPASEERGDPAARLRFYERLGATMLPLPYFQPSLGEGRSRVRDMLLICLDPGAVEVPAEALLGFLDESMEEYEGAESVRSDPEYRALRDRVTAWPEAVPLWPFDRLAEVSAAPARR